MLYRDHFWRQFVHSRTGCLSSSLPHPMHGPIYRYPYHYHNMPLLLLEVLPVFFLDFILLAGTGIDLHHCWCGLPVPVLYGTDDMF